LNRVHPKINSRSLYIGLAIIIVAMLLLFWLLNRSVLVFQISPATAVVTIDNKPLKLGSDGYLKTVVKPGAYTLKVEADGYVGVTEEIILKSVRTTKYETSLSQVPTPYEIKTGENVINNVDFVAEGDDFNTIFYFADNASTLYKAKFSGGSDKIESIYNLPISNPPLKSIKDIIWSPKKEAALIVKDDGVYFFDFKKYNFVSQEEVLYGRDIGDIAWSPDDSKIAYYYAPVGGEHSLIFANKTNTEMQRMLNFKDLGIENPYLAWSPDSEWLIIIPRNKDRSSNKIYLFNAYTRAFSTINEGGGNLEAVFSPDNSKILYSTYAASADTPVTSILSVMDKSGENKQSLNLYAHVGKSTWLKGSSEKFAVATYDKATSSEAIFEYDLKNKQASGFNLPLANNITVKEILSYANSNLLFYIANNQFYVANLK